mmetsp:Transcript_7243/g.12041  ORF Transcript_7243/g.12041 Transcript_7243/m.12041 type:complete len:138 (+) Transcript_7243:2-415(+)
MYACIKSRPSLLGSVRIEQVSDCNIYLGPCCTSVYIDSVNQCQIHTSCHQLRIHECHSCQLYVKVQSHPIIEDCTKMGFAPFAYAYPKIDADTQSAALSAAKCWDNVVDFRWHKSTPSPNWYVIPDEERAVGSVQDV